MQHNRGSNQAAGRAYNERLVLSLVRRHGGLAKADIARSTGLSPQTVSTIMRALELEGLLERGKPVKGRVGQPSVPMRLAADGAYSIGLKIGRRNVHSVLMDFAGRICGEARQTYAYPMPGPVLDFAEKSVGKLLNTLPASHRGRACGLGIAMPFQLWNWAEVIGVERSRMQVWRDTDLAAELAARTGLPIHVQNDGTAACGAELIMGRGAEFADFVYLFVGYFAGGGIVLDGAVYAGRTGNAGALGSMPVHPRDGKVHQLIDQASTFLLEKRLRENGYEPNSLWDEESDWSCYGDLLDAWVKQTAPSLAQAIVASCSVIDFPAAIIDGGFPVPVRRAIVDATREAVGRLDLQGIQPPQILEGTVGANARATGGALLPFFARYLTDRNALFKPPEPK